MILKTSEVISWELLSLSTRNGGLAIPIFLEDAKVEYNNSQGITAELKSLITRQHIEYMVKEFTMKKIN